LPSLALMNNQVGVFSGVNCDDEDLHNVQFV
jgi:hypothetical protein